MSAAYLAIAELPDDLADLDRARVMLDDRLPAAFAEVERQENAGRRDGLTGHGDDRQGAVELAEDGRTSSAMSARETEYVDATEGQYERYHRNLVIYAAHKQGVTIAQLRIVFKMSPTQLRRIIAEERANEFRWRR